MSARSKTIYRVPADNMSSVYTTLDEGHTALEKMLLEQISTLEFARRTLDADMRNAAVEGKGKYGLSSTYGKMLSDISRGMEQVVAAKVRLELHRKKIGEALSPAELLEAAVAKIKHLERPERRKVINELEVYHAKMTHKEEKTFTKGQKPEPVATAHDALAELAAEPAPAEPEYKYVFVDDPSGS